MRHTARSGYSNGENEGMISGVERRRNDSNNRARNSSSISCTELFRLVLSGILCGVIVVQLYGIFYAPQDVKVNVDVPDNGKGGSAPLAVTNPPTFPAVQKVVTGSPTIAPTWRPTASPTPQCISSDAGLLQPALEKTNAAGHRYTYENTVKEPKVFILDGNGANTASLMVCMLKLMGFSPLDRANPFIPLSALRGNPIFPDTRHYSFLLTDILILDGLRRHRNRVNTIEEADIIIPDFLPYLSYELPEGDVVETICPDLLTVGVTHMERLDSVLDGLEKNELWKKSETRKKFAFVHSRPIGQQGSMTSFSKRLVEAIVSGRSMVISSSKAFYLKWIKAHVGKHLLKQTDQGRKFEPRIVITPLLNTQHSVALSKQAPLVKRSVNFYFEDLVQKTKLQKLKKLLLHQSIIRGKMNRQGVVHWEYVQAVEMAKSKGCLIFDYDAFESSMGLQSLYNSIQASCMPILLLDSPLHLPFESQLDWNKVSLTTAGLDCLNQHWEEVIELEGFINNQTVLESVGNNLKSWQRFFRFQNNILDPRLMAVSDKPRLPGKENLDDEQTDFNKAQDEETTEDSTDDSDSGYGNSKGRRTDSYDSSPSDSSPDNDTTDDNDTGNEKSRNSWFRPKTLDDSEALAVDFLLRELGATVSLNLNWK